MTKLARSPSALSTEMLVSAGWLVDTVERRITSRVSKDLFDMFDLIAIRGAETLAIQVTSWSGGNFAKRRTRILECPHLPRVLEAGWRVEVHGWRKAPLRAGFQVKVEEIAAPI